MRGEATMGEVRMKLCHVTSKVGWFSRAEIEATRQRQNDSSRTYICRYCGLWHWGSKPKPPGITDPRQRKGARR